MNLAEQLLRMRHDLDELDSSASHWSDARLTVFLNRGQDDIVSRVPALLVRKAPNLLTLHVANINIGQNQMELPSTFIIAAQVNIYGAVATMLTDPNQERMLSTNSLYTPSTTNPFVIIPYYSNRAKFFPMGTTLVQQGWKMIHLRPPVLLESVGQSSELPLDMHTWEVDYGVAAALLEDGDARAAERFRIYFSHFPQPQPRGQNE